MNINEMYAEILDKINNGVLVIDSTLFDNAFYNLLDSFNMDKLEITGCSAEISGGRISVAGTVQIAAYKPFGAGMLSLEIAVEKNRITYDFRISFNGSGMLSDICNAQKTLIERDGFFSGFMLKNPALSVSSEKLGYRISGTASVGTKSALGLCSDILPEIMTFNGYARRVSGIVGFSIDFTTGIGNFSFPFGASGITLALRTLDLRREYYLPPKVYAFLLFDIRSGKGEGMIFQMGISDFKNDGIYAAAFFSPVLSPANIAKYLGDLLGIQSPETRLMLPDCAVLSDFGLQRISLRLGLKGERLKDGFEIKYVESTMTLQNPWSTPIHGLQLVDFTVFSEMSYINKKPIFSLAVSCEAVLTFGKYSIRGRVRGCYPQQSYEGYLSLNRANDAISADETEDVFTLADMARDFGCEVPDDWGKPLAEFGITAELSDRSYSIGAVANGIIDINIGNLKISVESITVHAAVRPSGNSFMFSGAFGFEAGEAKFQIGVSARYDKYWSFSGELTDGKISIGNLLSGLFKINASKTCADIAVDGLSVSFAPGKGEFCLYASFYVSWFEILGCTPKLGGKIKLEKKQSDKDEMYGSALFYLDIGALNFLVQADDFYTENVKYLFRLTFNKMYIQGVYYKEKNNDEIVRFSLGGMTFGDIVLAFIHLINPNAKSSLSAPWNVLDKINLSDFSVVINATQKTASVIYSANISIAGLMRIDDIGIRYSFKNDRDKISYILTGKLLDKTYGIDDPITWDALDGAPPENTAAAETKTKVSYIGLGSHLKVTVSSGSVSDAVKTLKEQLKPVGENVPDFQYSEENNWMFGADITLGDLFRLQTALIDPELYGAKITVNVTEKSPLYYFNGLELELVYRKISDSVGMFRCTLTLPRSMSRLDLGAVVVTLGQISLEIYTNGSFLIDLGFPHDRDFSKSFGFEYGIFTGRGGIYFGTLKGDAVKNIPQITNGAFSPVVLIGIGLRVGLGRSFDFGIVKGGVSLTATGILEGVFALFNPNDKTQKSGMYYLVKAAVGVCGTLFLTADLKIISISVSAEISAMCDMTIESYRRSVIKLSLYLKLSASLRILFIKINFSFVFDKTVEFTIGKDSAAPWKIVNTNNVRSAISYNPNMFPCEKLGDWKIQVSVLPLFSVKNPNSGSPREYCAAFICTVSADDFSRLFEMLFNWLLASFSEENVTGDMAASIPEKAEEKILISDFEDFFSKNLRITVKPQTENESGDNTDNGSDGIFFPMPHCLKLVCGKTESDYSQNIVTDEYCRMIGEYLARLNSDPFHEILQTAALNEGIPMSAAILCDYFRMILSELISLTRKQFEGISAAADNFKQISECYGISAEELLALNHDILLKIDSVPKYSYTVQPGDTLNKIREKFSMSADILWKDVSDVLMIPALGKKVELKQYAFDNRIVKMTAREAAAVFFVRLFDPDVVYFRYAEKLVSDNNLEQDWNSGFLGSRTLDVSGWSGKYTALAGDSAVRIAKASALVNGESADGWEDFLERFLSNNSDGAEYYRLDGTYTIRDNTLGELNLRLCPDFNGEICDNFLWEQPILSPWKDITLSDAKVGLTSVTVVQSGISAEEIADALDAGTAELSCTQNVIIVPNELSKKQLRSLILTADSISRTGAMISRFFLQGLRVPSPDGGEIKPLFELLRQQIGIDPKTGEFNFSIFKCGAECDWVILSDKNTAALSGEALADAIPDGELSISGIPERAEDFSEVPKFWSAAETEILLQNNKRQTICTLPEDMCGYFTRNGSQSVETADKKRDCNWACLIEFTVSKAGSDIYYFGGASPQERSALYQILDKNIKKIQVLCRASRFDTDKAEYTDVAPESCMLIRSDLSTETHMENCTFSDDLKNIAEIDEVNKFLLLAWECSVIGGGFWFYCTDIPENVFYSDGKASIYFLMLLENEKHYGSYINRAVFDDVSDETPVFLGTAEKTFVPNYPVGSIGIRTDGNLSGDKRMSELFSILGYTARTSEGALLEAMPILPQQKPDGCVFYSAAVPLYRLCGNSEYPGSPYSAVGQKFDLEFFRRDVLGNTFKIGSLGVEADYNDYLMSLNQIPCTETNYYTEKTENGVRIVVSSKLVFSDEDKDRALESSLAAMRQAGCDISIELYSTLGTAYTFDSDDITRYRNYTRAVYDAISGNSDLNETGFSVSFALTPDALPENVFKIGLTAKTTRKNTKCDYDGIKSAECDILRAEDFEDKFEKAFPDIILAAGGSSLYGIPRKAYLEEVSISPYSIDTEDGCKLSPRFYSTAPFSQSLITRTASVTSFDGESIEAEFRDIDIELWVKRFLGDIENMLSGDVISNAAQKCPKLADSLIEAKGALAESLADRLIPLIDGFSGGDSSAARETAVQLFRKSLNNVYDTDVICVYKSNIRQSDNDREFSAAHRCRMEGFLKGSDGLHCKKADSGSDYFCVYSSGIQNHSNEICDLDLSFVHFEYDVQTDPSGYESSRWLRLLSPLTSDKIDLRAQLGIPHPLKLFPETPKLLSHGSYADEEILRFGYTVRISCKAYEQQTLYLRLRFVNNITCHAADGDRLFDVLADYDFKRKDLLRHISAADNDFENAYNQTVITANALVAAMSDNTAMTFSENMYDEIILKINFNLSDTASIICEVFDERSREFVEKYDIRIKPQRLVAYGGFGKDIVFEAELSNMPIYVCPFVEPSVWIVQNENLFNNSDVRVNKAFLFRTEELFLKPVFIHAEYSRNLSADTIEQAVQKTWELLELSFYNKLSSVAAACCFKLDAPAGQDILTRIPAIFLPEVSKPGEVSEAVKTWLAANGKRSMPSMIVFKINVFGDDGYDSAVSAEISVRLPN